MLFRSSHFKYSFPRPIPKHSYPFPSFTSAKFQLGTNFYGLSKSTFQKMKRECFPDDKTNFSIDKRVRFFIRLCQCCVVMHLSLQMFLFSFFLKIYLDLDLSVTGKKKMMMKHNFGSRKLSPSGYHRRGKGEKEKKKMDAFSKMLKIDKNKKEG